ncbi:sugar 3,4-ketoisomerase [Tellurirhabdus bombi]|uniref:sugar 3,4-ketoisomerase n=1 Tax=Tellurirhabdus bombi TaxID=2907205 RepID=UPI001F20DDAF|nr:FdtA/QdtA family cupin domain-containing protein [Tellurirhabdus bombi]
MAVLLQLAPDFWEVGDLTFLEPWVPGSIQRVFYIYGAGDIQRAGHGHYETFHAVVCLRGSCRIGIANGFQEIEYSLHSPQQCLVLRPEDWHFVDSFSEDAIMIVLSNTTYSAADYFVEKPVLQVKASEICLSSTNELAV